MLKNFVTSYLAVLLPLLAIDAIWLFLVAKSFYAKYIGYLLADSPKYAMAGAFYLVYALGIWVFVVHPALTGNWVLWKVALLGAFFGFVAYGAYDFTNHATIRAWPTVMTIVDLGWGTFLTGLVSVIAVTLSGWL